MYYAFFFLCSLLCSGCTTSAIGYKTVRIWLHVIKKPPADINPRLVLLRKCVIMENVNQLIIMFTPVHTSFTLLKSNYKFTDPFIQNRNGKSLSGKTLLPCYLQPNLLLFSSIIVNQGRLNFYKINFYSLICTAVLCLYVYSVNRVHI